MVIADIAPSGKKFYEWSGTQEGLDSIIGQTSTTDPSTCLIVIPECDVTLEPIYINAGQHYVSVLNGTGSGYYNYHDIVFISATVPYHYKFANWAGDTNYLYDIYSASQSFIMKDAHLELHALFEYEYSYNSVQIINGGINVQDIILIQADNLREGTTYTLVPIPPDDSQGFDYWELEGYGEISSAGILTIGDR